MRYFRELACVLVALSSIAGRSRPSATRMERLRPRRVRAAVVQVRQTDESKFPDITVEVELKAANGEAILDASREEFRVREYGSPVAISGSFTSPISREFRPTTVVLVLDRSGSMQQDNRIGGLKRAVSGFLKNQPKGSRVAVIAFASEVELICPFTDDPEQVQAAVGDLFADGKTHFYDAVEMAVKLLSGETGRRAIAMANMTDGEDNLSRHADLNSAIRAAQKAGLPVHTLGLGSEGELPSEKLHELS